MEIDGSAQKVVQAILRPWELYISHCPALAGHAGERLLYDSLESEFYWLYMANDAYATGADCQSCAAKETRDHHRKELRLFPAARPLQFVEMDILGPVPEEKSSNQHVIVLTGQRTKLSTTILVTNEGSTNAATVLWKVSVIRYGTQPYLSTDKGLQLVSNLFEAVSVSLGAEKLTRTGYHPQTHSKVEHFNRKIVEHR